MNQVKVDHRKSWRKCTVDNTQSKIHVACYRFGGIHLDLVQVIIRRDWPTDARSAEKSVQISGHARVLKG